MSERFRLACFTPLPPQRSGIADYSAALLPYLAEHCAVSLYVAEPEQVEPIWARQFPLYSIADFLARPASRWHYDVCLYHMGNHPLYHEQIYQTLTRYPGIVVLHEIDLLGFYFERRATGNDPAAFIREMGYAYSLSGTKAARAILHAGMTSDPQSFPLFQRIAKVSQGIVVHTRSARARIMQEIPHTRVTYIPLAAHVSAGAMPPKKPDWLEQLPADAVVLGSFGYVAGSKRVNIVLRAVAHLRDDFPKLHYVLVGEPVDGYDPLPVIRELGLEQQVHITGFVDPATFEAYLRSIDIGVNLRTGPTGGEMSATLVRLLASGRPTLVSEVGGFAALPDDCVVKIKQDKAEVEQLVAALRKLILDPAARAAYGENARRYAQSEFSFTRVAQSYVEFIRECLDAPSKHS